jgi:hypothetical protein
VTDREKSWNCFIVQPIKFDGDGPTLGAGLLSGAEFLLPGRNYFALISDFVEERV